MIWTEVSVIKVTLFYIGPQELSTACVNNLQCLYTFSGIGGKLVKYHNSNNYENFVVQYESSKHSTSKFGWHIYYERLSNINLKFKFVKKLALFRILLLLSDMSYVAACSPL